ncbi:beta-galactosidase [Asticcacaulis sp. YBE204]|uniref:beta-galactosidase n=1 Tax=Asticcacaulis sp. YBE204 TaxID=1282363 RepID=UPI0003C3B2E8|nr:beta-galactosidase [Asticcacaulis sp. YBE204]ESQ78563.1 beta-galactosidase [Asticcacaulis sp. YBE204]
MPYSKTLRGRAAFSRVSQIGLIAALGGALAFGSFAQELGIPQGSDAAKQAAQKADAQKDAPVFLMSSFMATSQNTMSLFTSGDGVNFHTLASEAYTPDKRLLRDPSIIRHTDGYYYVVYTTNWDGADFGVTRSKDLKNWEFVREVKIDLPGVTNTWAPEWFRDKDGSLKVVVSLSKGGTKGPFGAYVIEANADLTQWSAPKALKGLEGNFIDTFVVSTAKGYTAFVKNETTKYIELATAKSLYGPWKIEKKGDWAGWGNWREGQALVKLPNGGWRIYFDDYLTKHYWYSDSLDGFKTWTAKKEIGGVSGVVRHFTVMTEDPKLYAEATKPKGAPKKVTWDEHSMMVDGKRVMVWSGEVHPFRLPNPSLWRDVLQKMKAAGFNGVAFYFDWGYHSPAPGVYDFSGVRNVERALEIAEEEGMYVIARTGPYVNAELTGGGFPGWMLRSRAEARTDDPVYLAATDEWMTQINAIIARHQITDGGGTVIAYQLENELGKVEPKHVRQMEHLAKKAREDGITVPFFHNAAGRLPDWTPKNSTAPWANSGPTDMYAFDGYPGGTCNVHADPSGPNKAPDWGIYGKNIPKVGSLSSPKTPGFAAELGAGWFDYWGSNGTYNCTAERQGKGYQRVFYGTNLINRITIHNIYMTFGGTSWGWLAGPVVYTSYDYGAPISEDRGIRPKGLALKQQGMFVQAAEQVLAEMDKGPEITTSNAKIKVYHNINPTLKTHILFAVHSPSDQLTDDSATFDVTTTDGTYKIPVRVNGQDAKMLLAGYDMERQRLVYSNSEIQTHFKNGDQDIALLQGRTNETGETVLRYTSAPKVEVLSGVATSKYDAKTGDLKISYTHNGLIRLRITDGGRVPLLLLIADEPTSYNFWQQTTTEGPVLQLTAALVRGAKLSGGKLDLTGDIATESALTIWGPKSIQTATFNGEAVALVPQSDGSVMSAQPLPRPDKVTLPDLETQQWTRRTDSPEAQPGFDDSKWVKADTRPTAAQTWTTTERGQPTLSMSDYGFHHGDVWYRGHVKITDQTADQLELFYGAGGAGLIQVWIDGKYIGHDELDTGRQFPETTDSIKFKLDKLTPGDHVISVMVRNNSHNWDLMADDAHREARGLIAASLTTRAGRRFAVPIEWRIQGNKGGEEIADLVRGPMNNGGLYGEREGWYLPGKQEGWENASPTAAPPAPGTYWLRTQFKLDLPKGHDVQLGLSFGDTTVPRSERENRVLIFVNGWNMGQFIAHIGPQRTFVIPPGILNPNGDNTITLAVTTDGKPENALEPVKLINLRTVRGGVPLEIVAAPNKLQR